MIKKIVLKLKSVKYSGQSIGEDISIDIKILDKIFKINRRIKVGSTTFIDNEITRFETSQNIFETNLNIKITEKDFLYNDTSEILSKISINLETTFPQQFSYNVFVNEKGLNLKNRRAIFEIILEVTLEESGVSLELKAYRSDSGGNNFNLYDNEIKEAVEHWNNLFSKQINPPPVQLDPNLVKAMVYVESRMGHYKTKDGVHPSYPDVMQVADPLNPAIYTLKNIFNPNPSVNKIATEYEIIDGKKVPLEYKEINIIQPRDSIYWGVRWLYHKAQINIKTNGIWSRSWREWRKAVNKYNGAGDKKYENKVFNVYENGIGERNYKLWSSVLILLVLSSSFFINSDKLDDLFIDFKDGYALAIDASYQPEKNVDSTDGTLTLSQKLHFPSNCRFTKDSRSSDDVLKNCTYAVGSNSSDLWSVKLTGGGYSWNPKNKEEEIIGHDAETDGPYYVAYEKSDIGDLNNDTRDDAVVVLRVNNGGNSMIRNIIILVQDNNGKMEQYANYIMEDREDVKNIYINQGIISADVFVKSDDDPACCASVSTTYRFKI